jgi:hypothetical protein
MRQGRYGMRAAKCLLSMVLLCLSISSVVFGADDVMQKPRPPQSTSERPHRADWLANGSFGMMTHYLPYPKGNTQTERAADLDRIVDSFDIDSFMKQFEQSGADWLIFTIGQNSGYFCSPNPWLDERLPGFTSKRDLLMEIGQRLHSRGKRFIVYISAQAPTLSREVQQAFAWDPNNYTEYLKRYLQFLAVYSKKLGKLCDGWWFDGCYPGVVDTWDWNDWIKAVRTGNADTIVAFSDAGFCANRLKPLTPLEDYHPGEVHMLEHSKIRTDFVAGDAEVYKNKEGYYRVKGKEPTFYMPTSRFIEGVQWHALVPISLTFNPKVPDCNYSDTELFKFTEDFKSVGGAVTFNLPINGGEGHIPEKNIAQLKRLSKKLGVNRLKRENYPGDVNTLEKD